MFSVYTLAIQNLEQSLVQEMGATPLGFAIRRFRWNLFDHVLRLSLDTPAQMAMNYYCDTKEDTDSIGVALLLLFQFFY